MRTADSEPQSNPLTIIAVVAVISLAADAYHAAVEHRVDGFLLLRVIMWIAFLFSYIRRLRWAYVIAAVGPLFFCLYWALYLLGGLSHEPHFRTIGILWIILLVHVAIVSGLLIWLFRIRERYFLYIDEPVAERT